MTHVEIKSLEEVLKFDNFPKFSRYETEALTAAGENYGSLILALNLYCEVFRDEGWNDVEGGKREKVYNLVAKLCPAGEFIRRMFNIPVTFKNEIFFYLDVVPTLQDFQRERGAKKIMDFFPKCFGSRLNLNGLSGEVDDDAVIILENLKTNGFVNFDCQKGFDLETTCLIIKDLAVFHAVPIALKLAKPEIFQRKLALHLEHPPLFINITEDVELGLLEIILKIMRADPECAHLEERVSKAILSGMEFNKNGNRVHNELFATMVHHDLWTNNIMIKCEKGKPAKNVIIDFQLIELGSLAHDILFFIYSSVKKGVVDAHYEDIIELYHSTFVKTIEELKCDATPFTKELLLEELQHAAITLQFYHVVMMMKPIYTCKGKVKDLSEIDGGALLNFDNVSELFPVRVKETILAFAERNWI